jgi:tetratricopeptide (TPR) repeat protein
MIKPFCFVLMPFGKKTDAAGVLIDFDAIYQKIITSAIAGAGLQPIRADEELTGGIIHKPMFERLMLCEYAVADLTTSNANVFYELGVRHAVRPWSTVLLFAESSRLPFDIAYLRALPYRLSSEGKPIDIPTVKAALTRRLVEAKNEATDSPLYTFDLIKNVPMIDHAKTDVFREQVQYSIVMKERLAKAREKGLAALKKIEQAFDEIKSVEGGVLIDLFLSYRSVKAWQAMIGLARKMPSPLRATVMVQEQLALALNRAGKGKEAERTLLDLIKNRGPSSETYGILGRVYKDRWEAASKVGRKTLARGLLDKAIDAYRKGFEADWRDAYPGVNLVTLMEVKDPPDPKREQLIPVVRYAVERKIAMGKPDYWDYATLLELAVLAKDEDRATRALSDALAAIREIWEPETTARNLKLIREARERRGESLAWAKEIEEELRLRTKD